MMPLVITSSRSAVLVLRKLLEPELAGRFEIKSGGGWDGAITEANSRLLNGMDLAVVVGPSRKTGANAREIDKVRIYSFMRHVRRGVKLRVIQLRTAPEGLLFQFPELLLQVVGHAPTPEQLVRARTKPRQVLAELLDVEPRFLARALRPRLKAVDLEPLTSVPGIRRLQKFMRLCARRYEARQARLSEHSSKTV